MLKCTIERPWGLHTGVRNDEDCPRCGWLAPGPKQDAVLDAQWEAEEREQLRARAAELGWVVCESEEGQALAA